MTVSVSPSALERSGSWVNVSWEGVASPSSDDWVGVYSPPVGGSIDPVKHAPVKFQVSRCNQLQYSVSKVRLQYANFNKSHMTSGSGSLQFRLVNMRDDVIMGFFTGGVCVCMCIPTHCVCVCVCVQYYTHPLCVCVCSIIPTHSVCVCVQCYTHPLCVCVCRV